MFNLNIPPSSLLGVEGSGGLCSTPKTPEILNSLIAMTNPLDTYSYSNANASGSASTTGNNVTVRNFNAATNLQCISQDSSHSSSSTSPLDSPAGTNTMPSVQQTCSQLIKAGLKLSIQSKRKLSTCESSSGSEQPNSKCSRRDEDCDDSTDDDSEHKSTRKGLTPEDEDRRRRRRERNKIAATKCRMKKRERTQNLIKESEQLDTQNVELKSQVRSLERERRKLLEMLNAHAPTCLQRGGFALPPKLKQSPAYKYLADLELDSSNASPNGQSPTQSRTDTRQQSPQQQQQPRTAIPPMSSIKFSRSDDFKAAAAAVANNISSHQMHQLTSMQLQQQQQQLPNGYCKASPTPQELGYLNSPSQDSVCLPSLHTSHTHPATTSVSIAAHQLTDYIPNCDNSLGLGLSLAAHTPTTTPTSNNSNVLIGGNVPSPLASMSTPSSATEFVKNELVDSQSPYTTAQSAERFLFEGNCDSFVDIKHAVNLNNNSSHLNHNNIIDFHSSLANSLVPFPEQISLKNDYLHEADFLAQLAAEGGEFVDLDTGVAAAFMTTNGGCLA